MRKTNPITDASILSDLVGLEPVDLTPEAARALLKLKFGPKSKRTMERLLRANSSGSISADDRLLLEKYLRIGKLVDLVQAKARVALHRNGGAH